jgi:hypothetical protein
VRVRKFPATLFPVLAASKSNHVTFKLGRSIAVILLQKLLLSDRLRAGRPRGRSSSPGRGKIFLLSTSSRPVLGPTQPPIQLVPGALSPGVKRPGCEADHSPPTSVGVKNT